ncbi:hypothetical protein V6N12_043852 [Hibiscus sabdariffa]|uniref:Uncharacterized protein n=1 Tax=Hibiscus sabdariffa TaxID=183260 RepID=A0ABR2DFM8_9ROSI
MLQTDGIGKAQFTAIGDNWDVLFVTLLWNIWRRRNDLIFNADDVERESVLMTSHRLQQECCVGVGKASPDRVLRTGLGGLVHAMRLEMLAKF